MPLFYQHNINEGTRLGIWHIEEPELFFLRRVPLKKEVTHPHKRLQHLAGRYLLPVLFDDFPLEEILIADTRKPFLLDEQYHFSISHCGDFAAALVSSSSRVGVDIEFVTPRIAAIRHKFIRAAESRFTASPDPQGANTAGLQHLADTLLWSAKEALFKWNGAGGVDFRADIQLQGPFQAAADGWIRQDFIFQRVQPIQLSVNSRQLDNLVLAWVAS